MISFNKLESRMMLPPGYGWLFVTSKIRPSESRMGEPDGIYYFLQIRSMKPAKSEKRSKQAKKLRCLAEKEKKKMHFIPPQLNP